MSSILIIFAILVAINFLLLKISCNKTKISNKPTVIKKEVTKVRSITTTQLVTTELSSTGS